MIILKCNAYSNSSKCEHSCDTAINDGSLFVIALLFFAVLIDVCCLLYLYFIIMTVKHILLYIRRTIWWKKNTSVVECEISVDDYNSYQELVV